MYSLFSFNYIYYNVFCPAVTISIHYSCPVHTVWVYCINNWNNPHLWTTREKCCTDPLWHWRCVMHISYAGWLTWLLTSDPLDHPYNHWLRRQDPADVDWTVIIGWFRSSGDLLLCFTSCEQRHTITPVNISGSRVCWCLGVRLPGHPRVRVCAEGAGATSAEALWKEEEPGCQPHPGRDTQRSLNYATPGCVSVLCEHLCFCLTLKRGISFPWKFRECAWTILISSNQREGVPLEFNGSLSPQPQRCQALKLTVKSMRGAPSPHTHNMWIYEPSPKLSFPASLQAVLYFMRQDPLL